MTLTEFMDRVNGDYDGLLERVMDDTDLAVMILKKFEKDSNYVRLSDTLDAGDVEGAFKAAHTLKGTAANLGLKDLYEASSACCEALRSGDLEGGRKLFSAVGPAYEEVISGLSEL